PWPVTATTVRQSAALSARFRSAQMSTTTRITMFTAALWLASAPAAAVDVCIDPGHGGGDPGAVGCGLQEKNININTSTRLKDLLAPHATVFMTRTGDSSVSLSARTNYANGQGADRFVSIHSNAASVVATGIETFSHPQGSATSHDLRNKIQARMIAT